MSPLAAEGAILSFVALAVLTLIIGGLRNVPWGISALWLVSLGVWAGVSAPVGWLLLIACLIAACLMPSRQRKPKAEAAPDPGIAIGQGLVAEAASPPPSAPSKPDRNWDERARRVPRPEPDGPPSAWEQLHR